jgi:threonine/homoserine/homoserine lactone efflux protein
VITFVVAVLLICASPGPAMALVLRRAAVHGWRAAVPLVLGLNVGLYAWALVAAAGLAALIAASETAFLVLRVVGAAVLIVMGVQAWRSALRGTPPVEADEEGVRRRSVLWFFSEGALVQLANPKAAVFMFAFYPQFVPAGKPLLQTTALLALLQVVIEFAFYMSLAVAVSRAGRWFRRSRVRRRLEAVTGTVLITLGLRLATTPR